MSLAEMVNSAMASRLPALTVWGLIVRCRSVGQLGLGSRQFRRERAVDHLIAYGDAEPAQQLGIDVKLYGNRVPIDAGQYLRQPCALLVAEVGRGAHMRHHFTSAGHRQLGQIEHSLVGAFATKQLNSL